VFVEFPTKIEVSIFAHGQLRKIAREIGWNKARSTSRQSCVKQTRLRIDNHLTQALQGRNNTGCSGAGVGQLSPIRQINHNDLYHPALIYQFFRITGRPNQRP
jgi:hypothetical protein